MTKKSLITLISVGAIVIIGGGLILATNLSRSNSRDIEETRESIEDRDDGPIHLESPVKIPEETEDRTPAETSSNNDPVVPTEVLQEYSGELEPIYINFAENRSHSTNGVSLGDITLGGGVYCARLASMELLNDDVIIGLAQNPTTIPLWVLNTHNSPFGNIELDTGTLYFLQLDGIVYPEFTSSNDYIFMQSLYDFLRSFNLFRTYLDSDLIPDENGVIHGQLYISEKVETYDISFNYGQEINPENTVTLQEVLLAVGLAAPDRTYTGLFSDIYNQYPDFNANYDNYPLFTGFEVSYNEPSQNVYRYHNGYDYDFYVHSPNSSFNSGMNYYTN